MEYAAGNEENNLRVRKSWKSQILPVSVIIAMCNLAAGLIYWSQYAHVDFEEETARGNDTLFIEVIVPPVELSDKRCISVTFSLNKKSLQFVFVKDK